MRLEHRNGASVAAGSSFERLGIRAIDSPVGTLLAVASASGLCSLGLERWSRSLVEDRADLPTPATRALLDRLENELDDYFNSRLTHFSVPVQFPEKASRFFVRVWRATMEIPFGETVSYGSLAARMGNPRAARAVGAALARNPCLIVVPCHRVVAAGGRPGGYAAGEELKEFLLALEAAGAGPGLRSHRSAQADLPRNPGTSGLAQEKASTPQVSRRDSS